MKKAYDLSFAEFTKANPGITSRPLLVPYADYFTKLPHDVGGGNADDIFWMNACHFTQLRRRRPYEDRLATRSARKPTG